MDISIRYVKCPVGHTGMEVSAPVWGKRNIIDQSEIKAPLCAEWKSNILSSDYAVFCPNELIIWGC